jgi:hypothetical protein
MKSIAWRSMRFMAMFLTGSRRCKTIVAGTPLGEPATFCHTWSKIVEYYVGETRKVKLSNASQLTGEVRSRGYGSFAFERFLQTCACSVPGQWPQTPSDFPQIDRPESIPNPWRSPFLVCILLQTQRLHLIVGVIQAIFRPSACITCSTNSSLFRLLTKLFVLLIVISPLSCIQLESRITVKPDGSGTVEETFLVRRDFVQMIQEMGKGTPESGVIIETVPSSPLYDEEKLKAEASEMGGGVTFVSGRKIETEKSWYNFNRILVIYKLAGAYHEHASPHCHPVRSFLSSRVRNAQLAERMAPWKKDWFSGRCCWARSCSCS